MTRRPLIVVVGPTASGKSDFAVSLAKEYDGEIICADSRTVYKGMDIGTAKPSTQDRLDVPHHLLDIVLPNEPFNAARFKVLANQAIEDIQLRGKLPILVGGSGLYVDAVIFDLQFGAPADKVEREMFNQLTIEQLQEECRKRNITLPDNSRNKRHLVRALELGGLKQDKKQLRPDTIVVGITTERDTLKTRIASRAQLMLKQGILDEAATLGKKYGWDGEAMKGNIYRIFRGVLVDDKPLEQAMTEVVYSDIHLAKRQITWLKRNPYIHWGEPIALKKLVHAFLQETGYIGSGASLLQ